MTVGGVLLAYWAATGVILATVDVTDPHRGWANDGGGPGAATPAVIGGLYVATAAALSGADVQTMTRTAIAGLRRAGIVAPVATLQVLSPGGEQRAVAALSGPGDHRVVLSAATGAILQRDPPKAPPGNDPDDSRHSLVKNWHRGTIGNAANGTFQPGNLLAFLTGLLLLAMLASGFVLYLRNWSARRRAGHGAFFWPGASGTRLRQLHRWVGVAATAFLLNQSVSGMLLASENIAEQFHFGARHAAHPADFTDAELPGWMAQAYAQARAAMPTAPIIAITLIKNDGEPFAPVFVGGPHPGAVGFKLLQHYYVFGAAGPHTPGYAAIDAHTLLKRIHRGDIVGSFDGRYLTLATGLSLLYLIGSGIWFYVGSVRRRHSQGRTGLFWR